VYAPAGCCFGFDPVRGEWLALPVCDRCARGFDSLDGHLVTEVTERPASLTKLGRR